MVLKEKSNVWIRIEESDETMEKKHGHRNGRGVKENGYNEVKTQITTNAV